MSELEQLRKKVDATDEKILAALCERVAVCREIGAVKKKNGLAVRDTEREEQLLERISQRAAELGLDSDSVLVLYREIVNMCSIVQR
ncbi:MAG: chorismate mutase [Candidatus Bathyarchaeota archaeon]|nr:chorismate mutase [Candidatus Bathyarchaeota archaeon]